MNRLTLILGLAASLAACDDDAAQPMGGPDMAMTVIPAAPSLGPQIDRMGRPAINTALNNPFNPKDGTGGTTDDKGTAKNNYNGEGDQSRWPTLEVLSNRTAGAEFAANLAIIDALDGVCGNQLLYGAAAGSGSTDAGAFGYTALAGALVDDELYVDTSINSCAAGAAPNYLAVEARAVLGTLGAAFTSCGGRTPLDDVIDISYTVLAVGTDLAHAVSDGVDKDADPSTPATLDTFPFLNPPNM